MLVAPSHGPSRASVFWGWGALGEAAGLLGWEGCGDVIAACGFRVIPGTNPSLPGSGSASTVARARGGSNSR